MDIIESLMKMQLSRHEANIYLLLLSKGALTGYEVSKLTGISRSNTYTALAELVEKGAAYIIEGTATRYTPLPIEEFCQNKIEELIRIREYLINNIKVRESDDEGYITIKGEKHILDKMRHIIQNARERIYISVSCAILHEVLKDIKAAVTRSIKVVIITSRPFNLDGAIIYYAEKEQKQIRLIADSKVVLTGDIDDSRNSTCLYSKKKNLVDLFKESLKNEIKLIELTGKD